MVTVNPKIEEKLIEIIRNHCLHNSNKITLASNLRNDHGIDSLKVTEMILDIEEEFKFEFEASALSLDTFQTVESLLNYVQSQSLKQDTN